ncbi:hypothetical protein KOR42_44460 [Thalassoglobus neptunius]|uniref:Uncharacterized protein n=1 Tax=Thalassoglobus neptunius TaxID=1938619 RepID=A0A5C5VY61_9PLAN|nr:hypothetical protein KOR42_44460 [Thalassoglobus neptunius]
MESFELLAKHLEIFLLIGLFMLVWKAVDFSFRRRFIRRNPRIRKFRAMLSLHRSGVERSQLMGMFGRTAVTKDFRQINTRLLSEFRRGLMFVLVPSLFV